MLSARLTRSLLNRLLLAGGLPVSAALFAQPSQQLEAYRAQRQG